MVHASQLYKAPIILQQQHKYVMFKLFFSVLRLQAVFGIYLSDLWGGGGQCNGNNECLRCLPLALVSFRFQSIKYKIIQLFALQFDTV